MVTHEENNEESLLITKFNGDGYDILEKNPSLPSRLYYTYINVGVFYTGKNRVVKITHSNSEIVL
jgi:hypothetical protein